MLEVRPLRQPACYVRRSARVGIVIVLLVLSGATSTSGPGGLVERLLAAVVAASVAALAVGIGRIPSSPRAAIFE
jgi:hypothetical protein